MPTKRRYFVEDAKVQIWFWNPELRTVPLFARTGVGLTARAVERRYEASLQIRSLCG
jgi:hypothetical protein